MIYPYRHTLSLHDALPILVVSVPWALRALATHPGSASSGRAIDTMSAPPEARMRSATSGMLMRLVATNGSATCGRSFAVTPANAPRGTDVVMVGTRASCQPIPVLTLVGRGRYTAGRKRGVLGSRVTGRVVCGG